MFVDLSLSKTGDIVYMRLFEEHPNKHNWGVFDKTFRNLFVTLGKFGLIIDTSDASIYSPKWIKKFVKLMIELTPETQEHVTDFVVVVTNDIVRKMVKTIVKANESERTVTFVKTSQEAYHYFL